MSKYQTIVIEYEGKIPPINSFAKKIEGCDIVSMGLGNLMDALDSKEGLERPDERILELAERMVAAGPKAAYVSASEMHEISDYIFSLVKVDDEDSDDE